MADLTRYYIHAEHSRAGDAGVALSPATAYRTNLTTRARLVRPMFAQVYGTYTGADRARERIRDAVAGISQWQGYTLSVREHTNENVGTPAVVSRR